MNKVALCLGMVVLLCATDALAQEISQQIHEQIVQQMVSNGFHLPRKGLEDK